MELERYEAHAPLLFPGLIALHASAYATRVNYRMDTTQAT